MTYTVAPRSDLEVVNLVVPEDALDGEAIDVTWQVKNNGDSDAVGPWTDAIYIALNGDRNQAVRIGTFVMSQGLAAGHSYTRTENFRLPKHVEGVFEVYVTPDVGNKIIDPDPSNDDTFWDTITIGLTPRPNLQVTTLTIPETVTAGAVVDVEWTVSNAAVTATPTGGSRWYDGVYLSLDNKLDGGDLNLAWVNNLSALASAEQYKNAGNYRIPQAAQGPMYIIVKVDASGSVDEYPNEADNVKAALINIDAQPVPPPDLVVSNVEGPTEAFDGTQITVYYKVTNKGAGVTFPGYWTDSLWLSADKTAPGGKQDYRIGSAAHSGALEVGEFYEGSVTGTIPEHLQGVFELMVYTDAWNQVFELTFDVNKNPDDPNAIDNNNFKTAGQPLTIIYTPPADLEVTHVEAPAGAVGGEQVTLSYTVANNGSNVTDLDRWADAVYIADNPEGQSKVLVFGLLHEGVLEQGKNYTEEVTFTLPPSAAGSYFIIETNVDPNILLTDQEELLLQMDGVIERIEESIGDLSSMSIGEGLRQDRQPEQVRTAGHPVGQRRGGSTAGLGRPLYRQQRPGRGQQYRSGAGRSGRDRRGTARIRLFRRSGRDFLDRDQRWRLRSLQRHRALDGLRIRLQGSGIHLQPCRVRGQRGARIPLSRIRHPALRPGTRGKLHRHHQHEPSPRERRTALRLRVHGPGSPDGRLVGAASTASPPSSSRTGPKNINPGSTKETPSPTN